MQKVTMEDIARTAGVSIGTVSKVLNGDPSVKEKNRAAVEHAVKMLDYNVNQAARRLAHKPIRLGIMLPGVFDAYFDSMEQGIRDQIASLADYRVSAVYRRYNESDPDTQQSVEQCLRFFTQEKVDGILLGPMQYGRENSEELSLLHSSGVPIVLLLSDIRDFHRLCCVSVDAALSGNTAAELAELCLKPDQACAILIGDQKLEEHHLKADSFCRRMEEVGYKKPYILEARDDPELAYRLTVELLSAAPDLALLYVATGNSVAVCRAVCDCGRESAVRVIATDLPEGLAPYVRNRIVIGVLDQHLQDIGARAVYALYCHLAEGTVCPREEKIAPSLLLYSAIVNHSEN